MSGENSVLHDLVAPHEHILHVLNITLLVLTVMCICFGSQTLRLIEGSGQCVCKPVQTTWPSSWVVTESRPCCCIFSYTGSCTWNHPTSQGCILNKVWTHRYIQCYDGLEAKSYSCMVQLEQKILMHLIPLPLYVKGYSKSQTTLPHVPR